MIFTTKAEYGVRLLIQLGRQGGEQPVSLKAIAEAENLPLAYLERIAALLKKAGLVEATRGAHGGYRAGAPGRGDHDGRGRARARGRDRADGLLLRRPRRPRAVLARTTTAQHCATKLLWTRVQMGVIKSLQRPRWPSSSSSPIPRRAAARPAPPADDLTTPNSETMADLEIKNLHVSRRRQADPQGASTCTSAPARSTP